MKPQNLREQWNRHITHFTNLIREFKQEVTSCWINLLQLSGLSRPALADPIPAVLGPPETEKRC
jgi:hypothetical protein